MTLVYLDFETACVVDLGTAGAERYTQDPTFEVTSLVFMTGAYAPAWQWEPTDGGAAHFALRQLANDVNHIFVSFSSFEQAVWRNYMVPVLGFAPVSVERWYDIQAEAAAHALPLNLDKLLAVTGMPVQKDRFGRGLAISMSHIQPCNGRQGCSCPATIEGPSIRNTTPAGRLTLRTPERMARLHAYNESDVAMLPKLHEWLGPLPDAERTVWQLDQRINQRGIRLDMPFVFAAQLCVELARVPLVQEFRQRTDLAPTQGAKFLAWLRERGVYLPDLQAATVDKALGIGDEDGSEIGPEPSKALSDDARRALYIRSLVGSASVNKLAAMEACVCPDGRARGLLQYHRAGTGRWAGRILQPQNFPRGSLVFPDGWLADGSRKYRGLKTDEIELLVDAIKTGDPEYVAMLFGQEAIECVASSLRHALVSSSGNLFLVGDFSGIEARIVLALAGQHDKCELLASGVDVYLDMAEQIYQRKGLTKANIPERTIGKNTILGCGFQMGWQKFQARYCPERDDEFAKSCIAAYRERWAPKVPRLWRALEHAAFETVYTGGPSEAYGVEYRIEGKFLTARLHDGKKLYYFNPQQARQAMPWDPSDVRPTWTYDALKNGQWRKIYAFGGLLTENVVQALARQLLVSAMQRCESAGLPIVLTIHDEIVLDVPEASAITDTLVQIMCEPTPWSREIKLPVNVEAWVGPRYRK